MSLNPLFQLHSDRRGAAIMLTALVHVALILAWQEARRGPSSLGAEPDYMLWLRLPARMPAAVDEPADLPLVTEPARTGQGRGKPRPADLGGAEASPAPGHAPVQPDPVPASATPSEDVRRLVEQARRDAGAIDRTLRKESKPTIVLPPDSPQIRMASKMREAAALAPNRLWEAPKVVELVNDGGDGARRVRVLTAAGVYCITERSPATSIDMIEKHGKQRITNCGTGHEQPANPQEWRTARD